MRKSRNTTGVTADDITNMLIEGGYLRAKIRSLTEFDRVAGGLAWGILNSRFSIDVEFVENAHIREKIRIAENICASLKNEMNCPHALEPYQIQGLDYPKLAIVFEWLLKRVRAAREEHEYFVSEYTNLTLRRVWRGSASNSNFKASLAASKTTDIPVVPKAPARIAVSASRTFASPLEHSAAVLLEYGLRYQLKDSTMLLHTVHPDDLQNDTATQRDMVKLQEDEKKEHAMLEQLLSQMSQHRESAKLGARAMQSLVAQHTDSAKLKKLRSHYEERRAELQAKLQEEEASRNALEAQQRRLEDLTAENEAMDRTIEELTQKKQSSSSSLEKASQKSAKRLQKLEAMIENVTSMEDMLRSDPERSAQFDHLLALLEKEKTLLKKLEDDKVQGKQRLADAKSECVEMAQRIETLQTQEGVEAFEAEEAALQSELSELQGELSRADQAATAVMRLIDEYPTRSELQQYEVRINELNEEVAWKFEDTRSHYNTFNTRTDIANCLKNEEEVFTQIGDLFEVCMSKPAKKTASERESLLQFMQNTVQSLAVSKAKQTSKGDEELSSIDRNKIQYETLLEKQKEYLTVAEELKNMVERNAELRAQVDELECLNDEEEA